MTNITNPNPSIRTYYDLADCPEDGGKHAIYCEHANGETSVLQDTNKRRLMEWKNHPNEWCEICMTATN